MTPLLVLGSYSSFRELIAETLVSHGYDVSCAICSDPSDPEPASENCLLVMDVFLPRREDIDVNSALESDCPNARIIAASQNHASCRAEISLRLAPISGADRAGETPYAVATVLQAVRHLESSATV